MHQLLIIAIIALATSTTWAKPTRMDDHFERQKTALGTPLKLRGTARMQLTVFLKIYDAALYLPDAVSSSQVLEAVPKRLEIRYLRAIPREKLIAAGEESLSRHFTSDEIAALKMRLDQINALYRDVEAGDRYELTFLPGIGTELSLNGARQGVIPGDDFARAYFQIWLGPKVTHPDVRDALLGLKK